jgi:hypothetical protein
MRVSMTQYSSLEGLPEVAASTQRQRKEAVLPEVEI